MELYSQIREVTVYSDRALVGREAHVTLAAGTHHLKLAGLPTGLDEASMRVSGDGPAQWLLHGFDQKTVYTGEAPSERVAALEHMLVALGDRERTLSDALAVHVSKLQLLQSVAEQGAGGLVNQLGEGRAKLADWDDLLLFLDARQKGEAAAQLAIEQELRGVNLEQRRVEAELDHVRGMRSHLMTQVTVTVELPEEGALRLWVEYVIHGASWTPAYDARLSAAGDKLEWRYYGQVRQQTGEHWEDVQLRLSTARPAEGSAPPVIADWQLSGYRPAPSETPMMKRRPGFGGAASDPGEFDDEVESDMPSAAIMMSAPLMAAPAPAIALADQGASVTLTVAQPVTLPSSDEPHQVPVGQADFIPTLSYVAVPKLSPHAYLEVEALHAGPWPILPGAVKAFVGQDYVGTVILSEDVLPKQTFRLAMGVDRAVQVRRRREQLRGEAGLLQKQRTSDYKFTLEVTNHKPRPILVRLSEPLPRATQEDIKVKLGAMSHPADQSKPGRLTWELSLAPQEAATVTWGYRVEHPLSLTVVGLE